MGNIIGESPRPASKGGDAAPVAVQPPAIRRMMSDDDRRKEFETIVRSMDQGLNPALDRTKFFGALCHELVGLDDLVHTPLGEALFVCWDTDGDGEVESEELWVGVQNLRGGETEHMVKLTFAAYCGGARAVARGPFLDFVTKSWSAAFRKLAARFAAGDERRSAAEAFGASSANIDALRSSLSASFDELDTARRGELTLEMFRPWALAERSVRADVAGEEVRVFVSFASPLWSERA
jgi:hypothetical protein